MAQVYKLKERKPQRGDVFYANLDGIEQSLGSEQCGRRPVLIIQNNKGNNHSSTTIVAVISTNCEKRMPTHVLLNNPDVLPYVSMIFAEQIKTIDVMRLEEYKGNVGTKVMQKVDVAIAVSVGMKKKKTPVMVDDMKEIAIVERGEQDLEMLIKDTELDRQQHDWTQMVETQLTFFSNVQQYLMNLKCKKSNADKEIEVILDYIEETNFNAAQGYKVYKMLQERQKTRKNLEREIRNLEIMLDYLDTEKLRRQYQGIAAKMRAAMQERRTSATLHELMDLVG